LTPKRQAIPDAQGAIRDLVGVSVSPPERTRAIAVEIADQYPRLKRDDVAAALAFAAAVKLASPPRLC
jgi:hypothetical protein